MLRESVVFRKTLITVLSGDKSLTSTHSGVLITSLIVVGSLQVASTGDTSIDVGFSEIPVSVLAPITTISVDVRLTVALSSDESTLSVFFSLADSLILRSSLVTLAWQTDMWIVDGSSWITIEEWFTLLAVLSLGIMHTIVANSSSHESTSFINGSIEVTSQSVSITVTWFTLVLLVSNRWSPRQIIVECLALLTIQSFCVVHTLAPSVNNVRTLHYGIRADVGIDRDTSGGVTVAGARTTDDDFVDGVVVLLVDFWSIIQQIISKSVQLREVESQIGDLQQCRNLISIWILSDNMWRDDLVDQFSSSRRCNIRVLISTNDICMLLRVSFWNSWETAVTVVGKVSVDLPRLSEICGFFDNHGGWTEGFECHDKMGEVEFCFQIQLNRRVLNSVLRLPPVSVLVIHDFGDDILDSMTQSVGLPLWFPFGSRVTIETFRLFFQMGNNTESLTSLCSTSRRRLQLTLSTDEQISGNWIARTVLTPIFVLLWRGLLGWLLCIIRYDE